jgi:hypothetical protein
LSAVAGATTWPPIGYRAAPAGTPAEVPQVMDNDVVRRLMWAGMVAATGALASVVANRLAAALWVRIFKEDPPE